MIEAMKEALEALKQCASTDNEMELKAIASLRQAIAEAEKQEPVAYLMGDYFEFAEHAEDYEKKNGTPLYAHPQPKAENQKQDGSLINEGTKTKQEPVGWIDNKGNMICTKINESCKPLYTTPQQRKPLTLEQMAKAFADAGLNPDIQNDELSVARAIEAAHGIKENT